MRKTKGFTLIELMIVVAIIGILAAIAIPNFKSFLAKTKRSEVKYNLEAIHKAEVSFFGEFDTFSTSFQTIRWRPEGTIYYYSFTAGNEVYGKSIATNPLPPLPAGLAAGAGMMGFTVLGWGNVDSDSTTDLWHITEEKNLITDTDDILN